ncbi:MAG TPA: universal stress protein [Geminicoccaceae bacterium]|jgi:nucleotide-binding universal stress UspA family protein|nr:universal stress protein [Geminicoccaceae bacterium]
MTRILACIDSSAVYGTSVCDLAAWAAGRLGAGIELLHVVQRKDAVSQRRDLSGAIGLGVKTELLEELTRIDEAEGKLAIARGRLLLDGAEERLKAAGVTDITKVHRHGGIVETIIEREAAVDFVVLGKRGASSEFATDHIGSKVERVVRSSTKPVLIASREIRPPQTIVVAFDGSATAIRAVDLVAGSPLFAGLAVHLVAAGTGGQLRSRLDAALALLGERPIAPEAHLVEGQPEQVIAAHMKRLADGLLVMGAYGHSPLRTLIVGSTTTTMIRTVRAPILLMR